MRIEPNPYEAPKERGCDVPPSKLTIGVLRYVTLTAELTTILVITGVAMAFLMSR
jgi:hypothetical protein